MKKNAFIAVAALWVGSVSVGAQTTPTDSLKMVELQEVQVVATRANAKTPVAFTDVKKEQISKVNFGQDLPFLLSATPSVLTTSDAGNAIGYTTIRVRGTDATRINITSNGIPMNDAESHSIFWVNTPDLASSLQDIQIQRGAGTSTNGAGAFGASINMRTQNLSNVPYAELSGSAGSYDTYKGTVKVGSGLLANHFAFDARISTLRTDGFRDRASANLKSYFLQGGYFGENTIVKLITFGGTEKTYHAWDGISREELTTNRTYNPNGEMKINGELVGFYSDQTDNYRQTHYQLLIDQRLSSLWNLNIGLHYTNGFGYYQEYKNNRTLKEYLLEPFEVDGTTVKKSNLVRKKMMDNDFGGGIFSFNYKSERATASLGGGLNRYAGDHFGRVIWVMNYLKPLDPNHEYYSNFAGKTDGNVYGKVNYNLTDGLSIYGDLQYRYIHYTIKGNNDKWDWTASPEHPQILDVREDFHFFNPKAGLFYQLHPYHSMYASFSVAQKEPTRNNYTDGLFLEHPRAEKLFDYEAGYTFRNNWLTIGANLYYMDYTDQLVLNGKLNEIGEAMAENVKDSYRMGIELSVGAKLTDWLRWDLNGTWSKNRIKNYVGYVSDYNADTWDDMYTQTKIEAGNTPISFSPSFIGNSIIGVSHKGFEASLQSQYVSRQYLDNFGRKEDSLDPYFVSHLNLAYTFHTRLVKDITLGVSVYNLFDEKYETNGYSMTAALYPGGDKSKGYQLSSDPRFYPMAGTNFLTHLTLRF